MLSGTEFLEMMRGNTAAQRCALDALMPHMALWATRKCERWLKSRDDALDVVQDVCIKLIEGRYSGDQPLEAWLRVAISNRITDIYRARRPQMFVYLDQSAPDDPGADPWATVSSDQPGPMWHREVLGCLYKVVAVLELEGPARDGAVRAYDFLCFLIEHEGQPSAEELVAFLGTKTAAAAAERKRALLRDKLPPLCKKHCGNANCATA